MKFKKGDKVICVDAYEYQQTLTEGATYVVKNCDNVHVYLEGGHEGGLFIKRFELAKESTFDKLYLRLKS